MAPASAGGGGQAGDTWAASTTKSNGTTGKKVQTNDSPSFERFRRLMRGAKALARIVACIGVVHANLSFTSLSVSNVVVGQPGAMTEVYVEKENNLTLEATMRTNHEHCAPPAVTPKLAASHRHVRNRRE